MHWFSPKIENFIFKLNLKARSKVVIEGENISLQPTLNISPTMKLGEVFRAEGNICSCRIHWKLIFLCLSYLRRSEWLQQALWIHTTNTFSSQVKARFSFACLLSSDTIVAIRWYANVSLCLCHCRFLSPHLSHSIMRIASLSPKAPVRVLCRRKPESWCWVSSPRASPSTRPIHHSVTMLITLTASALRLVK